jgi:PadR family transcriptional regulator, regulatory protein PadR
LTLPCVSHSVYHTPCNTHYVAHMPIEDDLFEKLRLELRRGSLILAVLGALKQERYGYTLRKELADAGLEIDEGALYPMLRRLESQGLLTSEWREEDKRNKRFYRLSDDGARLLDQLTGEWRAINQSLNRLI